MRGWFVRGCSGKQSAGKGRFFFTKSETSAGNGEADRCGQRCAGRIVNRFGRYHTIRQPGTMAVLAFPCFQDRLPLRRDAVSVGGKRALSPKFCIRQTIQAGLPRGTVSDGTGVFAATRTDAGYGCPSGRWRTNRSCHKPDCRQVPDHVFRPARTTVFPVRPVGMSAVVTASPRRFAVVYRIPVT